MYTWSKELETGNALIDNQHKQWIQTLNGLLNACAQGKGRDQIRSTLVFLQEYTAKHFHDEEALQRESGYPGFAAHRQYHETFKRTVQDIVSQYDKEGPTVSLVGKINTNLGGWFVNHIKREDVKVAEHLRQKAAR